MSGEPVSQDATGSPVEEETHIQEVIEIDDPVIVEQEETTESEQPVEQHDSVELEEPASLEQQATATSTAEEIQEPEVEEEEEQNGDDLGGSTEASSTSGSFSGHNSTDGSDDNNDDELVEGAEGKAQVEEEKAEEKQELETSEKIDAGLLEKQFKLIKETHILQNPSFKNASEEEQISTLVAILNSDPQTEIPHATVDVTVDEKIVPESNKKTARFPRPIMSQPMSGEEKERYSVYLNGETKITEIQSFPPKSRLFIGNLPLKNVTKENLFRIFSPYGHIFQINIKNAFGFIQYDNPKSVLNAIQYESEELNFGKKLILEVSSSNARPQFDHGDHGSNTSSTYVTSSKRNYDNEEIEEEDMYSDSHYKKSKKRTPQCLIYVKKAADRTYAYSAFTNISKKTGLETDMVILKPRMELRKLVNDAAYNGVWGVVLVNKSKNVDVQTFYLGPSGETKSDEYVAVSIEEAISIFNNIKTTKMGPPALSPVMNSQPYGMPPHAAIPQQPYGYMPPQQQYPGNVHMMPQQQMYGNMPPPQNYGMAPPPPMQQQQQQPPHGYQGYPQQPQMMPQQGALDQTQLLSALQNLPPNVVLNLLQLAQQPNQQQQQQALGVIQQIQAGIPLQQQQQQQLQQQSNQQQSPPPQQQQQQQPYGNYMPPQGPASNQPPPQSQQESRPQEVPNSQQDNQSQSRAQSQAQTQNNNNVQSLLDSLAKLQK
ncbi:unnamed protein product [Kluyveromyces dobzhanskii CBS 2104]|uniref:WGS project CCBQ000000000 data, contig 00008 n=1 Tax=Kluyveromyces dobzhanskii CBS 2104 TaxID=1427455 RepID=A0A0A8L9K5_9SACH|nr:unnamed protein product [Kluyveromyces dobzhanskii CBS 2104]